MNPHLEDNLDEEASPPSSVVIPVCDRGAFTVTNGDKDEDEYG